MRSVSFWTRIRAHLIASQIYHTKTPAILMHNISCKRAFQFVCRRLVHYLLIYSVEWIAWPDKNSKIWRQAQRYDYSFIYWVCGYGWVDCEDANSQLLNSTQIISKIHFLYSSGAIAPSTPLVGNLVETVFQQSRSSEMLFQQSSKIKFNRSFNGISTTGPQN